MNNSPFQAAIDRYEQQQGLPFQPKAVLFDMDGVLYDSMRFHAQSWQDIANRYHLKATLEDFYLFEGRTGNSTINELFQRTFGRDATDEEKKNHLSGESRSVQPLQRRGSHARRRPRIGGSCG